LKSWTDRIRTFLRLPAPETRLFARAWILIPLFDFGLRVLSFSRLQQFAQPRHALVPHDREDQNEPDLPLSRMAWLVERAGQYNLVKGTCLTQALVLSRLLARSGVPTTLRIGVARPQGPLTAHAWLEYQGQVIIGHQEHATHIPLQPGPRKPETPVGAGS
jgi:hypothetical protein